MDEDQEACDDENHAEDLHSIHGGSSSRDVSRTHADKGKPDAKCPRRAFRGAGPEFSREKATKGGKLLLWRGESRCVLGGGSLSTSLCRFSSRRVTTHPDCRIHLGEGSVAVRASMPPARAEWRWISAARRVGSSHFEGGPR